MSVATSRAGAGPGSGSGAGTGSGSGSGSGAGKQSSQARAAPSLRVLGIDPGTRKLGWGVVERRGARLIGVAAGVLSLSPEDALASRLSEVFDAIDAIVTEHSPQVIAVEDIFYARFANAAIKLGHVRGVVLLAGHRAGLTIAEYAPALVKKTVAGRGASEKAQMARMVAATLKLRTPPPSDAADALAIAITHLSSITLAR